MIKDPKYKKITYDPFRSGRVEKAIAATQAQREMWSTLTLDPSASICYNEVICMELKGNVSVMRLDKAYQLILKRHEALRSSFSSDGKYFNVHEYVYRKLEVHHNSEQDLQHFKNDEVRTPFDLVSGPLTRACLLQVSQEKSYFIFSAHHIVCDGWSLAIILTELSRAYEEVKLAAEASFIDFALKENRLGVKSEDRNYWLNIFSKPFPGNQLPLDFSRPIFRSFDSERIDLEVSSDLVIRLKKYSAKNRISFYTLLMGGFSILLKQISKNNDVVVGMATAAQSIPGNEEVVGHLVNMLPIRSQVSCGEKVSDYLLGLKKQMMDAIEHQCYSFGSLISDLNIVRNPREIPIINVVFNIDQQLPHQGLEFNQLEASYQSVPRLKENFEIFINAVSRDKELTLECQFNTNLFKRDTISNWLKSYVELLELIIKGESLIRELHLSELLIPQPLLTPMVVKEKPLTRDHKVEHKLLDIWKDLLKKDITVEDNFFNQGGHSLLVVELIQQIESIFHKKISVREVFENPFLQELSLIINGRISQETEKISRVAEQTHYEVSPAQLQAWYLEEIYPATPMHNLPASIELKFEVSAKLLEETLNILIKRHEALRTSIKVIDGLAVSIIHENAPFTLPVIEVAASDVQGHLNNLASAVIDISALNLFHAKLLKISSSHYVFFFMPHHMIWDGWSFDIFFKEIDTIYSALVHKTQIHFNSTLSITYKDYAGWLNQKLALGHFGEEKEYWLQKLALPLPLIELSPRVRPEVMSHQGKTFAFEIDASLADRLRTYSLVQGVSLYNVLLTAFKMSLSKLSQSSDVIVGTPVRCRNFPELLNVIGYFVNTVALRTHIDEQANFTDNLQRVIATSIEAFDHSQLPFQQVLRLVKFPRDASRTPIYQTFFSYQDVTNRSPLLAGHLYQQINIEKNSTHTDLDLWIKTSKSKIEGAFEYREDLFDHSSIENFYQTFLEILDKALAPEKKTTQKLPTTTLCFESVISLFEENVRNTPFKEVIKSENSSLTYSQLNERANIYAHELINEGIGSGDFVGIALSRHTELLPALLGILKSGAAYIPLDPAFPQERLDYMVENSGLKILITEKKHASRFQTLKHFLIEEMVPSRSSQLNPQISLAAKSSAYIIYTSGSTGKPKGVEISHESLTNFLVSMKQIPGMSSQDHLLAVTTLSFDIAGLELLLPLICGASLYLASQFDVMDGEALKNIIEKQSINFMQATPSTWRLLLAAGWKGNSAFKVLCGGEAFPRDLALKLIPMVGSVWNMYGPTETTIWSTCKQLSLTDKEITVGKVIANTTIYIMSENGKVLPQGEEGELYIGGLGVAKGYHNRGDLTLERFIKHPQSEERIYATGDLAKINQWGELIVLGRLDGQVKVRGYRIELGEIEAQLNMMKGIEVAAAITKEVTAGDARIIAFIITEKKQGVSEEELRDYLLKTLPKYMIPSHFVFIESMPQTLNGKIDKKSLAEMFQPQEEQHIEDSPQHSTAIEEMREIWKKVLAVEVITDDDHFFDIGGNSLLAVDLSNRVSKHFGRRFQLRSLLETPVFLEFSQEFLQLFSLVNQNLSSTHYLVPMKKDGKLNPLFCIHAVGGNVLNYVQLLPAIKNRPVYGLQSAGLVSNDHPGTISGLASLYIKEMRTVQPHGPYFLAGGSMGGMIAFEIAQQLKTAGEEIGKLILFDTFGPDFDLAKYENANASRLENWATMINYYSIRLVNKTKKYLFNLLGAEYTQEMKLIDLEEINYRALWDYRPQSYAGDFYLVRNELRDSGWYADPHLGWKNTVKGEIHVSYIKAAHREFIESSELLDVLKKLL